MLKKSVYINHILLLISIVVSIRVCEVYLMTVYIIESLKWSQLM